MATPAEGRTTTQSVRESGPVQAGRYGERVFRAGNDHESDRLHSLAAMFDPFSQCHMAALAVGPGWRCLDVGSGPGTLASWLADRGAEVMAIDRDTRFLSDARKAGVQVVEADLLDSGFDPGTFDLVHARCVLLHLREREQALRRLVTWVRPGGWLLVSDTADLGAVSSPNDEYRRVMAALWRTLADSIGTDVDYGRRQYPAALGALGLVHLGLAADLPVMTAGSPAAAFWRLTLEECRAGITATGLVDDSAVEWVLRYTQAPATWDLSPLAMITAWGQKPGDGPGALSRLPSAPPRARQRQCWPRYRGALALDHCG
jgi:2-polyprenyl-3-methyl-5-hydroxy-6-metoxy-1,4-benzoquinol methylase